jgi:hypothetical protein
MRITIVQSNTSLVCLVYIIPPLINFFGKLISVGELIASGYASLVGPGIAPQPGFDVAPLVQPTPGTNELRCIVHLMYIDIRYVTLV